MSDMKTMAHDDSVDAFLDRADPPQRRADGRVLAAMMARVSGEPPRMWGAAIIGFGAYRYRYESGREGEMCRIGFSPRKASLVLYLPGSVSAQADLLGRLGKHSTGKGCLYIKKLGDIDEAVLEEIVAASWDHVNAAHP